MCVAPSSLFAPTSKAHTFVCRYWSFDIQNLEVKRTVQTDMFFSMFSMIFVYFWISMHTGSFFLGSIGMLQIVSSLPIGNFFYKVVGQIQYFDTLHTLVIFLVLGVGADDVFVLVDAWYQTAETMPRLKGESHEDHCYRRMHVAYGRTVQAVFNTSFTTAMAFVATAISPIMPISTFGMYAAICIVINYIMTITITPGAIIVYECHVKHWPWYSCCFGCFCTKADENADGDAPAKKDGIVERFLKNVYIPAVTSPTFGKVTALVSICLCVAWGVFAMLKGFKLTPPMEQEKWFPDHHMFTGLLDDNANMFLAGVDDQYVKFSWAFGIKGIDRDSNDSGEKFSVYKPNENRGTVIYDASFDVTNVATQQDILDACELIRTKQCDATACNFGALSRDDSVTCVLEEFNAWLSTEHSETWTSAADIKASSGAHTRTDGPHRKGASEASSGGHPKLAPAKRLTS